MQYLMHKKDQTSAYEQYDIEEYNHYYIIRGYSSTTYLIKYGCPLKLKGLIHRVATGEEPQIWIGL